MDRDVIERIADDVLLGKIPVFADEVDYQQWLATEPDLRGVDFTEHYQELIDIDLSQKRLDRSKFDGLALHKVRFVGSKLCRASLVDVVAEDVSFQNVDACWSKWSNGNWTASQFRGAWLVGADLRGCNFAGCDLTDAKLIGVKAEHANFSGAKLVDCVFDAASLNEAVFDGADITRCSFLRARGISRLSFPTVRNPDLIGIESANFWGSDVPIPSTYPYPRNRPGILRRLQLWIDELLLNGEKSWTVSEMHHFRVFLVQKFAARFGAGATC